MKELEEFLDAVICGDNCDVMRRLPSDSIDMVVTSPPYDSLREYGKNPWDFEGVAWNLQRILKEGGVIVWNVADSMVKGSETLTSAKQALYFKSLGLRIHDTMIFHKKNFVPQNQRRYEQAFEYVYVISKGKPACWNPIKEKCKTAGQKRTGKQRQKDGSLKAFHGRSKPVKSTKTKSNVWPYGVGRQKHNKGDHPATFPLAFAEDHIRSWSDPGAVVLDPFAGSGTTLIAAKNLERHYIGIEVYEVYAEQARENIEES